eukprot:1876042-Amphidinium_carterae.2
MAIARKNNSGWGKHLFSGHEMKCTASSLSKSGCPLRYGRATSIQNSNNKRFRDSSKTRFRDYI